MECANCKQAFMKTSKGYNRKGILTLCSPRTASLVFPNILPEKDTFLCQSCISILYKKTTQRGKKRRCESPTPSKHLGSPAPKRKGRPVGFGPNAQAFRYLQQCKYESCFRTLLRNEKAKTALQKVCTEVINKERKELLADKSGPFRANVEPECLEKFAWENCLDWGVEKAPVMMACLKAMFPEAKRLKNQHTLMVDDKRRGINEAEAKAMLDRRTGMVLSQILYTTNNRKQCFIQACLGVEMWRQGCSLKMFRSLNSLGICQSMTSAVGHVDRLRKGYDAQLQQWRAEVEHGLTEPTRRRLKFSQILERGNSYSVTWDNVQVNVHEKHQSQEHGNKVLLWALAFAHRNKINFDCLRGPAQKALEVPLSCVLPTPEAYTSLRERMVVLVMRILVDNLTALKRPKTKVVRHIPHLYTEDMQMKSSAVTLGVIPANPSSTAGVLEIMDELQKSVPIVNGEDYPILCCGDGLSVERMVQCFRANGCDSPRRSVGLVEAPQEFHKEMILLQDTMTLLFKQESEGSRGTLSQIKGFFHHKSLKEGVKANPHDVWDFLEFVTGAYITLYAATICGIKNTDETPEGYPKNKAEEQMKWLTAIAQQVVDFAWMPPAKADLKIAAAAHNGIENNVLIYPFCSCEEDTGEDMVQCCNNQCQSSWFHLSCVGLEGLPKGNWYCSADCEANETCIYCYCHKRQGGGMVMCHLGDNCKRFKWYHYDCLTPQEKAESDGSWYCSNDCLVGAVEEDQIQNYSKAVIWEGLCHLARRDAVCEGDGDAMTQSWKMDMVSFWNRKNHKYFIIAHQMLTGIEGFLPERLRADMTWNRVANLQGKAGGNVGLDLVNEFINNDFKDMLKSSRGTYTEKQIARCAELSGRFGKEVDRMFSEAGVGNLQSPVSQGSSHKKRQRADIATFVTDYHKDGLFEYLPGRAHSGFKGFAYERSIWEPMKMGQTMLDLAVNMDAWRDLSIA